MACCELSDVAELQQRDAALLSERDGNVRFPKGSRHSESVRFYGLSAAMAIDDGRLRPFSGPSCLRAAPREAALGLHFSGIGPLLPARGQRGLRDILHFEGQF